jgi:tight adherence protein B
VVAQEAEEPVGSEFRQVFEEQRFGLPLRDSLLAMADRLVIVDVRIFVTAVLIQRESGGNLAEILDNLSYIIRERFKFRRQLRAQTAQGRLTGHILMVMPIIAGIAMSIVIPDYMQVMFHDPRGRTFLIVAIVLQIMGYFAIRKIVDIEF